VDLAAWNDRYKREPATAAEPAPLVVEAASHLSPGAALDLASGAGRNALWLAERGWRVTAVDGASSAIERLRQKAAALPVEARIANLERGEYEIAANSWDLILFSYYLQRDLFPSAKLGVKPGGLLIAIVHLTDPGEAPTPRRARPGELRSFFQDWNILRYREGQSSDPAHARPVAEIAARRP
jgi:SAM-dependent methyltransferase